MPIQQLSLSERSGQPAIPPAASVLALDHGSDGVLIADMRMKDQLIVHVKPAFESITGYSAVEAIGKNCRYLQGSDRLQPEIRRLHSAYKDRQTPIPYDPVLYRQRHCIENAFERLNNWRRIETCYNRCAHTFFSAICIAAAPVFWLT